MAKSAPLPTHSVHGRLTIRGWRTGADGKRQYNCDCNCVDSCAKCNGEGCNSVWVNGNSLHRGRTQSCGCRRAEENLGRSSVVPEISRFGWLVFVSRARRRWSLRCEAPTGTEGVVCGATTIVDMNLVLYRGKTHCGCLGRKVRVNPPRPAPPPPPPLELVNPPSQTVDGGENAESAQAESGDTPPPSGSSSGVHN